MEQPTMQPLSMTPTIERQTPRREFGHILQAALENGDRLSGLVSGALMHSVPGVPILSAAVNSVSGLANARTAMAASTTGVLGGGTDAAMAQVASGTSSVPPDIHAMVSVMRAEADRSMRVQMEMQEESREYNTVSNVLKVRHDSAKSAINNIR